MSWKERQKTKSYKKYNQDEQTSLKEEIFDEAYFAKFLADWEKSPPTHPAQQTILDSIFVDGKNRVMARAGRKFSKTTTAIKTAWRIAHEKPRSVIYYCLPTIAQAIEVVWEENRLQWCDLKDQTMFDKYVAKTDDSKHILTFANGSFIKLIGTWSEKRGRGTQPDFLVVDELQDCSEAYLDAMDPNLAAKDGGCLMIGTPPKTRNHFYEWQDRIHHDPNGKVFKYTSYDNKALPHLKEYLDRKKAELYRAGKEDEWLREYMAEDCFSHADRVLPDATFLDTRQIDEKVLNFPYNERIPFVAVSSHLKYFCAIMGVVIHQKSMVVTHHVVCPQVWSKSVKELYPQLSEKFKELQNLCGQKPRHLVWDESNSFQELITGFTKCRKDLKWQDRGIPLLREMMLGQKIHFSENISEFGLECQKLLSDESEKDLEKNYPMTSTLAMLVNEYFQPEKIHANQIHIHDKYQGLRDMGIPCPPPKKRGKQLFRIGH